MTTTLTYGAITLDLGEDLIWVDEHDWVPAAQVVERSITGALLIDVGALTAGRPITLEVADALSGWMTKATLDDLHSAASVPGQVFDLTLRGSTYAVIWRTHEAAPISAEMVAKFSDPTAGDFYRATLRFMTV